MGTERSSHGYMTVAASGPLYPLIAESARTGRRGRAYADLEYTTADAHHLAEEWANQTPFLGGSQPVHHFLNDPTIDEFLDGLVNTLDSLETRAGATDWSQLAITLSFCGHGRPEGGALELKDGILSPNDLVHHLESLARSRATHGLRLGLLLDSCFSGEFLIQTLDAMTQQDILLPYYSFASAMPDEEAFEDPELGHGLGTYCFSVKRSDPFHQDFLATAVQPDNSYGPSLAIADRFLGTTLLSFGQQNAIQADPFGELSVTAGTVIYRDTSTEEQRPIDVVRSELLSLRNSARDHLHALLPGWTFNASEEARVHRDPYLEGSGPEASGARHETMGFEAGQAKPHAHYLPGQQNVPQPPGWEPPGL